MSKDTKTVATEKNHGSDGTSAPRLRLLDIKRNFHQGEDDLRVLRGIDLTVDGGELVALRGPSGSGKSTLLHVAGLLEPPSGGEVFIDGAPCHGLSEGEKTSLRGHKIGFVYQYHHLLPEFTALENIIMPQLIIGRSTTTARRHAGDLLDLMRLTDRADHYPGQLSGGEQQRVAIARAVANGPSILLADEPTGNLDPETSAHVFRFFRDMVHDFGLATLFATHNTDLALAADRSLRLDQGLIVEE